MINKIISHWKREIRLFKWQLNLIVLIGFAIGFGCGSWVTLEGAPRVFADSSAAGTYTWTFDSAGDYSLSSSTLGEIAANKFRFKVRNYTSDASTKWLAHLDETSGTVVDDVSSNNIDGTLTLPVPTPTTTWLAGKLDGNNGSYGGLGLDGNGSYISVPDTSDVVTLSQNMTLEAWVKFNNTFSTTSHATRQSVFDKGEYQMYFDQQTGKLDFELASNATNAWSQKAGNEIGLSWDSDGKNTVTAVAKSTSYLYAGTGSGAGDAEVWQWNGSNDWNWVGGNGIKSSWSDNVYDEIVAMTNYGDDLIVGTGNADGDADLWYFDADANSGAGLWSQIGGDSGGTSAGYSWNTGINNVTTITVSGTKVYVGTGNGSQEADLWVCDLSTGCTKTTGWTQIGGDSGGSAAGYSWNLNYDQVWGIYFIGSRIHVGLGNTAGEAELWACDTGTGCTKTTGWTKMGGDGVLGSWADATYEAVMDITSYVDTNSKRQLVVALGATAGDAEIWRCNYTDTTNCTAANAWGGSALVDGNTGSGTAPQSWNNAFERVWNIVVDDQALTDTLYVGLGDSSGDAEVWSCDLAGTCSNTAGWTKLGGDGANSSWSGAYFYTRELILDGTTLYAGLYSTTAGLGELWQYNGSWSRIGGQYLYGGWGYNGLDKVMSMSANAGKMYVGTGTAAGDSTVWEYDGTNWSLIGGQLTNSSWPYNTIETVEAMAPYKGALYAGIGNSVDDGQVWKYNGTAWSKIGGNGATQSGSWANADDIEVVYSLAGDDGKLYAGLGNSTDDGKIFSYDGNTDAWTQIAGRKSAPVLSTGWQDADNIDAVLSMISDGHYLYAGLGLSAGDSDVWKYDKNAGTWSQIANGGALSAPANGSWWNGDGIEGVYSLEVYNGELFAGLGASTGDAKVYKYNGSSWTLIGGLGAASGYNSWPADYEVVRSMGVYNGYLFATLGTGDGESEVWRWDGSVWLQVGGDSLNSGWLASDNFNTAYGMTVYKGKLYTGTGDSSQTETTVWGYGNNLYLESDNVISDSTNWHHYAVTYDGTIAKMYVDGNLQTNTTTQSLTVENSSRPLLVGTSYGGFRTDTGRGFLDGKLDEIRISNSVRATSDMNENTYSSSAVTVRPVTARMTSQIDAWTGFSATEGATGSYGYCLSSDNGSTWKYWYSGAWTTTTCETVATASSKNDVNSNIGSFPVTSSGILWKAVLSGDGTGQSNISNVQITGTSDISAPTVPSAVTMKVTNNLGATIAGGTSNWYEHAQVYVSWGVSKDNADGSGDDVSTYHVYFGTDNTAVPSAAGTEVAAANYTKTFTAGTAGTYYLMVQAEDNAGNLSAATTMQTYQFDDTDPSAPTGVLASPSGYSATNVFSFTWTAPADTNIRGYKYKVNSGAWSSEITETSVTLTDQGADGVNTFYVVAVDAAGNTGASGSREFYLAGAGPTAPLNLEVDGTPKTENSFYFTWDPPTSYLGGNASVVKYCYTINEEPSADTCTNSNTLTGATSLGPGAYATQEINILYVIAKNPDSYGGSVDYAGRAWATKTFVANTTAPGLPTNVEIADISIKSTSTWRLTISWAAPSTGAASVYQYKVYRSGDNLTFSEIGATTGTAYVDTGLSQQVYYYQVRACDRAGSCSAYTSSVSATPAGKYTEAANLSSGPTSGTITTKKATVTWSTDRTSDSKVQYGTSSGSYITEEPSNSTQTTDHSISLTNLSPGTTYYYKAKWTDEDGNTGISEEKSFKTDSAPTAKDVTAKSIGLTDVILEFTTSGASKVKIYYGETTSFGGVKTISTSTAETTYTTTLEDLADGTKYYYKINVYDSELAEYEGTILNFTTLPRPKINNVRIQQITGTAQPTVLVTWATNTEVSSIVTYYPAGSTSDARDEVNVALTKGEHRMIVRKLNPQTDYVLVVKGRDKAGNEASSDAQKFTTATDTRPPQISGLTVEGSNMNLSGGSEQTSQLVVTWNTDEPGTSQVEFGEGSGTEYAQKTQEDANMTSNHLVVISGLVPSKVYHVRALSKDVAGNFGKSVDTVTITPKATEKALDLVISNLSQAFGFLNGITQ